MVNLENSKNGQFGNFQKFPILKISKIPKIFNLKNWKNLTIYKIIELYNFGFANLKKSRNLLIFQFEQV